MLLYRTISTKIKATTHLAWTKTSPRLINKLTEVTVLQSDTVTNKANNYFGKIILWKGYDELSFPVTGCVYLIQN